MRIPKLSRLFAVCIAVTAVVFPAHAAPEYAVTYEKALRDLIANAGKLSDDERLNRLMQAYWDYQMHDDPEWATYAGYPGLDNLWMDLSPEAYRSRETMDQLTLDSVNAIELAKLNPANRLNRELLKWEADIAVKEKAFPEELIQITQLDGIHHNTVDTLDAQPKATEKDYLAILARLSGLPKRIDQAMTLLTMGVKTGITPPKITLREVPEQIANLITEDPLKSAYLTAFTEMPRDIPKDKADKMLAMAKTLYTTGIKAKLVSLKDFVEKTYIPGARETTALSAMPNGAAWYAHNARYYTTTNMTPEEIHKLGLSEVARIRAEMEKVLKMANFSGTMDEFFNFLRTDARFFYTEREELVTGYRDIAKRADAQLIKLFGVLPRLPYGIEPIPAYAEKSQTTAYYMPGAPTAGRPGIFYANTYELKSRPKWEMEALALHEAVPGHHLQLSIAKEIEGLPDFRKESEMTAFVEGWGLYAESLGEEMGFYKDPYAKFGQLSYEMWRAIRLVVDTGMHALGWTRAQAIDYFTQNVGKAEHDITVEVDRYLVWPGQALAYKIGELKIKELKNHAKSQLGDKFDSRAFHDVVLGAGPLPMTVLDARVKAWVKKIAPAK